MAHTDSLPPAALQSVAQQVGERLHSIAPGPLAAALAAGASPAAAPVLGESFTIYVLGLDAIQGVISPPAAAAGVSMPGLEQLATPANQWHHQVRYGGQAQAFARSMSPGDSDPAALAAPGSTSTPDVMALFTSPLAERIDQAIDWIDLNVPGDPLVRLLIAPAFYLHALWLTENGQDQVLVVDRPDSMEWLSYQTLYDGADFLNLLAGQTPVQGLPEQLPAPGPS